MSGSHASQTTHAQPQLTPQGSSNTVPWAAAFMAGTQAGNVGQFEGDGVDKAQKKKLLATGIEKFKGEKFDEKEQKETLAAGKKNHRSELPPLPTQKTNLEKHPMGAHFKQAELDHLASHRQMKSWTEVSHPSVKRKGSQILDCMWVYTYKLNKHHNT
ncbi:hypothetical protein E4U25_008408 [Claviceps purpurea]|nr:hypothetical protein E4U25_008408 [Claviceps purpurea]